MKEQKRKRGTVDFLLPHITTLMDSEATVEEHNWNRSNLTLQKTLVALLELTPLVKRELMTFDEIDSTQ